MTSMKERRKKPDRRVRATKQGLPPYYARGIPDRRRKAIPMELNQAEEIHIESATRDVPKEYANSGREQALARKLRIAICCTRSAPCRRRTTST